MYYKMLRNLIKPFIIFSLILLLYLFSIHCQKTEPKKTEILVFAPASMSNVLPKILKNYNNNLDIIFDFGGSAILASKISYGAPANIYISAGESTFRKLENDGLIYKNPKIIVKNSLVVVTTKEFENINTIYDINKKEISRIAIANPDFAPAGEYAKEALINLKIWDKVKEKIVFGADVRSTLNYVITENADIAIVYASDVLNTSLKPLEIIPLESYSEIIYPASIIKKSNHQEKSEKLLEYLISKSIQEIFHSYGFNPIININSSN